MEKEKQIEEIDNLTTIIWEANHKRSVLNYRWLATEVYNAGYREKSEVAREIFEEVKKHISFHKKLYENNNLHPVVSDFNRGARTVIKYFDELIAEFEKKYIGEVTDNV